MPIIDPFVSPELVARAGAGGYGKQVIDAD
jgi:hypothetical protein